MTTAASPSDAGWACEAIWDGVDFTPCFRERYLVNAGVALAAFGAVLVLASAVRRRLQPAEQKTTAAALVPPHGDNLARLEANVLVESVASDTLPAQKGAAPAPLPLREAEKTIDAFRTTTPQAARRWEVAYRYIAVLGAAAWLAASVAVFLLGAASDWRPLVFPAFIFAIAFVPTAPVVPLVTLHIVPAALLFRSLAIAPYTEWTPLAPAIVEIVYWSALVSVPYNDRLDRLLAGAVSHGGGSSGAAPTVPKHLEEPTSAFSRATYTFILPFLWKHYWKPVVLDDIPAIREDDGAAASLGAFRAFQARRDTVYAEKHDGQKRTRNLGIELILFFSPELAKQAVYSVIFCFMFYLPPVGLRLLLKFIEERKTSPQPNHVAWLYILMMASGQGLGVTAMGQCLMIGRRVCVRIRAIIIAEVFAKALRRQDTAGSVKKTKKAAGKDGKKEEGASAEEETSGSTDGQIANLVAVDAFSISEVCAYIFYLVSGPVSLVINIVMLYQTLGVASLAGVAMLLFLMPFQALMGKLFTIFQRRLLSATDRRLDAVTEVMSHIKLIKFNAWESKFFDRMAVARKHELFVLGQRFALIVIQNTFVWGTPVLVAGSAFAVHVLVLGKQLDAQAFAALVLFNMLRDPVVLIQDTVTRLLQSYTSCTRIQAFLDEPDTLKYSQLSVPGPSDPSIGFTDAIFVYPGSEEQEVGVDDDATVSQPFRLGELDLSFPVGQLSLVTGPVGSGKTTLILSLLGETTLLKGKFFMPDDKANRELCTVDPATGLSDTVAYCAQTPWLVGASIRENITFGTAYDEVRYQAVVHACALERDFEIFDLGDATEVGEKGTTCSGGQKARIALARALYSSAKTIILDDVISAVDAQTARHIYVHVLQGPLMQGRTCILVTHAVSLVVPAAAFVVQLDDGHVTASGTPAELVASGSLTIVEELHTPPPEEVKAKVEASADDETIVAEPGDETIEEELDGLEHDALIAKKAADAAKAATIDNSGKQLVQSETSTQGAVNFGNYELYFRAMGSASFWLVLPLLYVGTQALQVITNAWIRDWATASEAGKQAGLMAYISVGRSATSYLLVYVALSGLYLLGVAARTGLTFVGSLHASDRLYKRLLRRILGAKMRFFDSTPSGRIMNRLSKDIASIDQEAAEFLAIFVNCVLICAAVVVVIVYTTPTFVFALAVILVLYWCVGTLYVTTSREIKRYDSITRSPIFVSFSEALVGMSTIRSYGDSARFTRKLLSEVDANTRCFWYLWQTNRVLNNLSNFVGMLVTISASALAIYTPGVDAGAVGFSVMYALSFTETVLWVVRLYAAAEMAMNSVERVAEYLDLDVEEEPNKKGQEPPAYWRSRDGSVVVEKLTCKYAPQLDPVLREVSFTIGPKEKIGICGRTGSGKSTLALSFFRFLHQESGRILIDGLDISKLSLSTLRSRLTILPQEAQLFSGSVRDNMDPFSQHEDYEVWEALRQCGLAGRTPGPSQAASRAASRAVSRAASTIDLEAASDVGSEAVEERVMIRSLDEQVAVGGKNFSQGQRQLLALARGLLKLRTSSFLIMDESTANLDHATDTTIQNVLRTGLADTQMLVIAHRLMTVSGLDKILVLDHGRVVEFGTPWELLQDENGSFRDLCRQSGEEAQLFELAKSVHERKQAASEERP